jgi:hypothetical protein
MKRRTLLMAAPLAALVPCEIAEAMKSTFASVAHESLARGEKEQGGAMGGSTVVYELRIYHVVPGKIENLVARFPGPHDEAFCGTWNQECCVLDCAGRTGEKQHLLLHSGASEPGSGGSELEGLPGRSGVEEREGEIGREWKLVEKIDSTFLTLTDFSPRWG